ncbi:hypothetical protein HJFPF1_06166 [Paramyrothecium foliicola]|nr:hypothetical protein HJFPF1_06166 [Paramyrothecium foliicola]
MEDLDETPVVPAWSNQTQPIKTLLDAPEKCVDAPPLVRRAQNSDHPASHALVTAHGMKSTQPPGSGTHLSHHALDFGNSIRELPSHNTGLIECEGKRGTESFGGPLPPENVFIPGADRRQRCDQCGDAGKHVGSACKDSGNGRDVHRKEAGAWRIGDLDALYSSFLPSAKVPAPKRTHHLPPPGRVLVRILPFLPIIIVCIIGVLAGFPASFSSFTTASTTREDRQSNPLALWTSRLPAEHSFPVARYHPNLLQHAFWSSIAQAPHVHSFQYRTAHIQGQPAPPTQSTRLETIDASLAPQFPL